MPPAAARTVSILHAASASTSGATSSATEQPSTVAERSLIDL
jgi:hypothetical protein